MKTILHFTPAAISFNRLLDSRLRILHERGYKNIGFSTCESYSADEFQSEYLAFLPSSHLKRSFSLISDFRYFLECLRVVRDVNPDVVMTYGPKPSVFARFAAALLRCPRRVHVSWGLFYGPNTPSFVRATVITIDWFFSFFSHVVFSENALDLDTMKKYPLQQTKKFKLLGQAVDIEKVYFRGTYKKNQNDIRNRYGLPYEKDQILFLTVARVVREKGYIELLAACRRLTGTRGFKLIVCGRNDGTRGDNVGIDLPECEDGSIRYLGELPAEEVARIMSVVNVFILASHREGFPRSTVEAVSMGLPVITTSARGCAESIVNNYNGLLVPVGDEEALFNAIGLLVGNKDLRKTFSKNSRALAIKKYDERLLIDRLINAL